MSAVMGVGLLHTPSPNLFPMLLFNVPKEPRGGSNCHHDVNTQVRPALSGDDIIVDLESPPSNKSLRAFTTHVFAV